MNAGGTTNAEACVGKMWKGRTMDECLQRTDICMHCMNGSVIERPSRCKLNLSVAFNPWAVPQVLFILFVNP